MAFRNTLGGRTPEQRRNAFKENQSANMLKFPKDVGVHSIQLFFKEYDYGKADRSVPTQKTVTSILLPLPDQLIDVSTINAGATELGVMGAAAREIGSGVFDAMKSIATSPAALDLAGVLQEIKNIGENDIKKTGTMLLALGMQEAVKAVGLDSLVKGIEAGAGYTINPYAAIAFNGVQLRGFTFSWTLAPRSKNETDQIIDIVHKIKAHIHPKYEGFGNGDRTFLKYPDILHLAINGQRYPIQFKPCMVKGFTADYSGAGEHVFLEGGDPAVWKLTMSVEELEIWDRDSIEQSKESG